MAEHTGTHRQAQLDAPYSVIRSAEFSYHLVGRDGVLRSGRLPRREWRADAVAQVEAIIRAARSDNE